MRTKVNLRCGQRLTGQKFTGPDKRLTKTKAYCEGGMVCNGALHTCGYQAVCVFVYTYVCVFVYTYVCVFVYTYVCVFVYTYVCVFVYTYVCVFVYTYVCVFVYTYVCGGRRGAEGSGSVFV